MKTKEELNALKEEVETLNKKLAELSEDELKKVAGGSDPYSFDLYDIHKLVTETKKELREAAEKMREGETP